MEFPSAVFIKALKVDLFCRDLQTLIYTKNKKKKVKGKNPTTGSSFYLVLPSNTPLPYSRKITSQKSRNLNTHMSGHNCKISTCLLKTPSHANSTSEVSLHNKIYRYHFTVIDLFCKWPKICKVFSQKDSWSFSNSKETESFLTGTF